MGVGGILARVDRRGLLIGPELVLGSHFLPEYVDGSLS